MSNNRSIVRRTFLGTSGAVALGYSLSPAGLVAQTLSTPNASGIKVEKDVVVGKTGNTDLHCDVYRPPAGTEKRMALIHFHGGGFARGSKDTLTGKATSISARGYGS